MMLLLCVLEVLRETQLADLSNRLMNELSGGERRRAVLAPALATEASVLLLNKPTANLDLAHQAMILALVRKRCDAKGTSALVVRHDINLAAEFADYVLLMKDGETISFWSARRSPDAGPTQGGFCCKSFGRRTPDDGRAANHAGA